MRIKTYKDVLEELLDAFDDWFTAPQKNSALELGELSKKRDEAKELIRHRNYMRETS
jgi:hypothetical protein